MAIQVAIEDGYLVKDGDTYVFNSDREYNCRERVDKFISKLKDYADLVARQLDERYKFQAQALAMQFPLLMHGMWMDSEKLKPKDTIESVMKHGTLGIGFIGLAEALTALTGKHHGESVESQTFGLQIVSILNEKAKEWTTRLKHNYSVIGTPAEGLSGRFTIKDAKDLTDDDKEFVINNFFDANYQTMIFPFEEYNRLYQKRISNSEYTLDLFNEQEYSDLLALFNLAWFDVSYKNKYPELRKLFRASRIGTQVPASTRVCLGLVYL